MATLMITGGKLGTIMGRRKAMGIGLVIYAAGSFTTGARARTSPSLLIGWSLLEGIGAALIMPAIVALVASNFPADKRAAAYGLVAAAGARGGRRRPADRRRRHHLRLLAVRLPRRGGHRAGHPGRAAQDQRTCRRSPSRIDLIGSLLSVIGLGPVRLRRAALQRMGLGDRQAGHAVIFDASLTLWFMAVGLLVVYGFLRWEGRLEAAAVGNPDALQPLVRPSMLRNRQLTGGLGMFFAQFMIQAGAFFAVPLFLSVVLGLNALQTGVRLVPLSIALLLTAIGIPKLWPKANPRRVVRIGLLRADRRHRLPGRRDGPGRRRHRDEHPDGADGPRPWRAGLPARRGDGLRGVGEGDRRGRRAAEHRHQPRRLDGHRADRVGADRHPEHGRARPGSPTARQISDAVKAQISSELVGGVPFISDAQLRPRSTAAGVQPGAIADAIAEINATARLEALQVAFALVGLVAIGALFITVADSRPGRRAPPRPSGRRPKPATPTAPTATDSVPAGS